MKTIRRLLLSLLVLGLSLLDLHAAGKTLLYVSQHKPTPDVIAADQKAQQRLAELGFTVTFADQYDSPATAEGKDLVVLSAGASAHRLEGKYRKVAVPVVVFESHALPHMAMTSRRQDVDFGTKAGKIRYLWLVNAPHPLSAGLAAGMVNVVQKGCPINWGRPGPGAIVIATFPDELDKAQIFAYEKGATMEGENLAPARRVMLFLDGATFPNLNANGLRLFDAAVLWAAGVERK